MLLLPTSCGPEKLKSSSAGVAICTVDEPLTWRQSQNEYQIVYNWLSVAVHIADKFRHRKRKKARK